MEENRIRLDDLAAYRARSLAGVAMERDRETGRFKLHDTAGLNRSDEQMERDVATAAVHGRSPN